MIKYNPHGALPLFIGGGDRSAVRGCENSEEVVVSSLHTMFILHPLTAINNQNIYPFIQIFVPLLLHPLTTAWSPPPINRGRAPSGLFPPTDLFPLSGLISAGRFYFSLLVLFQSSCLIPVIRFVSAIWYDFLSLQIKTYLLLLFISK